MIGAARAAEDLAVAFDTVADYVAAAMRAGRRHGPDRAFEPVEDPQPAVSPHLKGLVRAVAADLASGHDVSPLEKGSGRNAGWRSSKFR
jgi:hypothetical protein